MKVLIVQVSQPNPSVKNIIIGVVYKPPNTNSDTFLNSFGSILDKINRENRPTYLLGDYNFDILKYTNAKHTQAFLNLMLTFGMLPKIDRPTRINKNSATLIDNIFTNVHQADIESGLWIADISDHLPIFTIIPSSFTKLTKCSGFIHKRIYPAANMNNFHEKLSNTDWSDIHQAPTTQDKYNLFTKVVNDLHEHCFPVTKVRTNPTKSKPWITTTILKSIKKKNKMYKKCLTNKSVHLLNSYKKYRNTLTSLIRAAEKSLLFK